MGCARTLLGLSEGQRQVLEPSVLEPNVSGFWRSGGYRKKLETF